MTQAPLELAPGEISLATLRDVHRTDAPIRLQYDEAAVDASAAAVAAIVAEGKDVYGINTGFGRLARVRIEDDSLATLQRNLILSHATGTGPLLDDGVVRLILVLKAASLARGASGVRRVVIDSLLALLEHGVLPCIPGQGSVGASGDLAPLAHMSAALIGVGDVRVGGVRRPAIDALREAGIEPLTLGPKEGLALINGTQVSAALALAGLFATEDTFAAAVVAGALSIDAARGSDAPFDPRIHALRGQLGQVELAATYRRLLAGSAIRESHADCDRVQDPYSLRCQPQVMGACLDQIRHVAEVLRIEANAVTDNPLVFTDTGEALSGGNFHAEPVALVADSLAVVLAEIGNMSERRIALLTDTSLSGLPAFLVADAGVNSGFMIAHVTAAALASENKQRSFPASVDTIPTSANQEDHVSMATHGARRLLPMSANTATIVGIEVLAAAQGIEFHRPLRSSEVLEGVHAEVRAVVARWDTDRYFEPDIDAARALVQSGRWSPLVADLLPSLLCGGGAP